MIEATNKRYLLAVDASRSMQYSGVLGCNNINPLVASASMALLLARTEPSRQIVAVSNTVEQVDVPSSASLTDVCEQFCKVCRVSAFLCDLKLNPFDVVFDCS